MSTFDISDTLAPNSDQLDAIELAGGPRTFTIERVTKNNADQPINVHLAEFPRPWRPAKSMRRVLASGWGTDASQWAGRRVTLYFDPEVTFGKDKPGGTRISHMSHLDKPLSVPLLVARGKSAIFKVEPLPDSAPTTKPADPDPRIAALQDEWRHPDTTDERKAEIRAEVDEIRAANADRDHGEGA